MAQLRVWDLPTRLFHLFLVLAVAGLFVTGQWGGAWMEWHFRFGYAVLVLWLFRVVWGLVGGHWSRFSRFMYSPRTLWRYLQGHTRPEHHLGHSPTGALSVWAVLLLLGLQCLSGLCSDDEIAFAGPLSRFVSSETVSWATAYHTEWGQKMLLVWIGLHLTAIIYHRHRGHFLVKAMVTGDKPTVLLQPASADGTKQRLWALAWALACVAVVVCVANL